MYVCYTYLTKQIQEDKTMKHNALKVLIPGLCAAVLLTGCSLTDKIAPDDKSPAETTSVTRAVESGTAGQTAQNDEETIIIQLNGSGAEAASDKVSVSGSDVTVTGAGTYLISGSLDNGSITVDADNKDKLQLVLNGVNISSGSFAAIYVKQADKVSVTLAEGTQNTLSNGGTFTQRDDNNVDAVIFSKDDVTFSGTGALTISSPAGHGIVSKDDVTVTDGTYTINAAQTAIRANDSIVIENGTFTLATGTDGLHAENGSDDTSGNISIAGGTFTINVNDDAIHANSLLQIDAGTFDITGAEGLEATYILINDGDISINASDDGINAARKSSAYTPTVEINGGNLTIVMGAGDTDGVDSNGNIIITGGTVDVTGQTTFDYDGTAQYTGGIIIVNGQQVDSIPNQMMGGPGGGMPEGGMQDGGFPGGGMPGRG